MQHSLPHGRRRRVSSLAWLARLAFAAPAALTGAARLAAQAVVPARAAPTDSGDAAGWWPPLGSRDWVVFSTLTGSGLALMPADARIERAVRARGPQGSDVLRTAARGFNAAGDPGALAGAVVLFIAGRATSSPPTARLGLHAMEAIAAGGTTTAMLKLLTGRQRPNVPPSDADAFVPGRGYRAGRTSFPSGHTTAAFAFAASLATDLRATHARGARVLSPLLYGGAALVGAARVYENKHWASDVVVGAAVGTLAGRAVAAYGRSHRHGWIERLAGIARE